jgi:hypothetical protein
LRSEFRFGYGCARFLLAAYDATEADETAAIGAKGRVVDNAQYIFYNLIAACHQKGKPTVVKHNTTAISNTIEKPDPKSDSQYSKMYAIRCPIGY